MIYFLADLHLGAAHNPQDKEVERRAVAFLDSIKHDAQEIYLLGDILDYWYEYKKVVPRGFVRLFGKLAELTDAGIRITWLIGNHDIWIFDYIPSELGVEVVDGVLRRNILGVPFCIQHGDAIVGSRKFVFLRRLFRNRFCQWLYAGIHPRWTVGFAQNWSRHSREENGNAAYQESHPMGPGVRQWCEQQIAEGNDARYFLFGHLHKAVSEELPQGRRLEILPAFMDEGGYGRFDGTSFQLRYYK